MRKERGGGGNAIELQFDSRAQTPTFPEAQVTNKAITATPRLDARLDGSGGICSLI